ncbi:unnamed protein product [Dibothriocephalus latus]|uniref:Uncharacterized protein n=1 Tax=Dibothriocephalus latus TaxID=60516 RepID=A0A3P7QPW2_DIBLA|nr:unnamed protein product [Dibothriocephalus latus]
MSRNLRIGIISPHCCRVFGNSRLEKSASFSDIVAFAATAPDPVDFNGPSSNAGTTGGCNNMGQKMEEATDRVGHEESSNDATTLEETERNSRDGEPSVPGSNPRSAATNHNASA